MKRILLVFTIVIMTSVAFTQEEADTAWKVNGDVSLMFSQSSFTNWAPGGDNNITLNGFFNYYAGYFKGKSKWETLMGLAYGQSRIGEQGWRKNEDKIDLLSTYGLRASEHWYYSANFSFRSQFAEGFDYNDDVDTLGPEKISNFLAPAFITLGIGGEYRPKEFMSFYISPATARWIVVNDQDLADQGAFGVEKAQLDADGNIIPGTGETTKFEFGAYFRFLFVKDIAKNVNLNTKLELYSDYLNKPENIDVNWDTQINLKVNSWLSAMFGLVLVYDDDTPITDKDGNEGPRTQIKQLFSAGFSYQFKNR
jgi:hypothetical protein